LELISSIDGKECLKALENNYFIWRNKVADMSWDSNSIFLQTVREISTLAFHGSSGI